jgi:hypothetical protein
VKNQRLESIGLGSGCIVATALYRRAGGELLNASTQRGGSNAHEALRFTILFLGAFELLEQQ